MCPKNVYEVRETFSGKLDSFGITYTKEQKLFEKMAISDFESFFVQESSSKDTNTTAWLSKHLPISVSLSSNRVIEFFSPMLTLINSLHPLSNR